MIIVDYFSFIHSWLNKNSDKNGEAMYNVAFQEYWTLIKVNYLYKVILIKVNYLPVLLVQS